MRILFLTVIMALVSIVWVQPAAAGLVYEKCEMLYEAVDAICADSDFDELAKDTPLWTVTIETYPGSCQALEPSTTEGKKCTQTKNGSQVRCECTTSGKVKTR